jgi:hypothetical protein
MVLPLNGFNRTQVLGDTENEEIKSLTLSLGKRELIMFKKS